MDPEDEDEDDTYIRTAAAIHFDATKNNILVIAVIFVHENKDPDAPIQRHVVLSPPTHKVNPEFISDVFTFLCGLGTEPITKVPESDLFAHRFFVNAKRAPHMSHFWITFAQFEHRLNTGYTATQQISIDRVIKKVTLSTQYYASCDLHINERALLKYNEAFMKRWQMYYCSLILINPLKTKPFFNAWHVN